MKVRIDIDTKTFIRFILVVLGFALLALGLYNARVALTIIGISFFLAIALNVPVSKLSSRLPGKSRAGATAISYVAIIMLLIAFFMFVVPPFVQQTAKFIARAPEMVQQASEQWQVVGDFIERYNLQEQVDTAVTSIKDNATTWAADFGAGIITSLGSLFSFLAAAFLVFVITFLMLVEGPEWMKRLWKLYNNQARMERHRRVLDKMYNVVTGYVVGQITISGIGAAFSALFVFALSLIFPEIPSNLAFPTAAIAFVLSLIPMFGATIAGIIISVLIAFNSIPGAIIFAIYFIVYQQIENNFISPHVQSKRIDMSALTVLVAATVGIYMAGIAGGIIAIPIAGCIRVLLEEYFAAAAERREKSEGKFTRVIKALSGKSKTDDEDEE